MEQKKLFQFKWVIMFRDGDYMAESAANSIDGRDGWGFEDRESAQKGLNKLRESLLHHRMGSRILEYWIEEKCIL